MKESRELFASFSEETVKVCDTEFCTKTSFSSVLTTLKRNAKLMLKLSRRSQYGSINACNTKKKGGTSKRTAQSSFNQALNSLDKLPDQACD